MGKLLISLLLILLIQPCVAQSAAALGIYGDVGIPVGDFSDLYRMGYGGKIKFLKNISDADAFIMTTGINFYTIKLRYTTDDESQTYRVIPFLIGYRHQFSPFFIEPSAGAGIYQMRHELNDVKTINWHTAFTAAVEIGYLKDQYEMAVRYQTGLKKDDNVSVIVFNAGYRFTLSRRRS
jgi:hypothetical protein